MLLNREQRPWLLTTALATGVLLAGFALVFHPDLLPAPARLPADLAATLRGARRHQSVGNSPLGLAYGTAAYAIFLFAALLGVRRRFPLLRVGRARTWLRAHVWLTILTLPLVFLHANARFGGPMTSLLMWLYLAVMVSGFYGLALQQFLPARMKERVTLETIYEQIPYLTQQLLQAALKMRDELRPAPAPAAVPTAAAAGAGKTAVAEPAEPAAPDPSVPALVEALERNVLPYLAARRVNPTRQFLAGERQAGEFFRGLRLRVAAPFQEQVDQLASWCDERRQMDLQSRLHHWLHGWLFFHAPASFLLVILTGWHAVVLLFLY